MKFLTKILEMLHVRKQRSIGTITGRMASIVTELKDYAEDQARKAEADAAQAESLLKQSKEQNSQAANARTLADRYAELTI